jgi:hypothetical protein
MFAIVALAPAGLALGGATGAGAAPSSPSGAGYAFHVKQILAGANLSHRYTPAGGGAQETETLSHPDDITSLGDHVFVAFQNGVGPQGQPSTDLNTDSTVVEITMAGAPVAQWDVLGKVDGLTADPQARDVIATVNEDLNSSLYTIEPSASPASQVTHYDYDKVLPHGGGTDAISIYNGRIFISASAPGTGPSDTVQPAVYIATLDSATGVAKVKGLFDDKSAATVANLNRASFGKTVHLALTDPDSNEVVPWGARFGGEFMLTSQGDQEQIFVSGAGTPHQSLQVLSLSRSVDDTVWPTTPSGRVYATDSTHDTVDVVAGPFIPSLPITAATPCGANSAPPTCPGPGFGPNYLGAINPWTGQVIRLHTAGAAFVPQGGLLFVAANSFR